MHNCKEIRAIIETYLSGELSPSDKVNLDEHLLACADCRELLALHEELSRMDGDVEVAEAAQFRSMRSAVLALTSDNPRGSRMPRTAFAAVSALATAALLVMGIFLGRWSVGPQGVDDQLLLSAVVQQASMERNLDTYWDAPLSYANVTMGGVGDDQVNLGFDVCRSVALTTDLDSPVASDVLTHAILNSESIGGRLQAMELAAMSQDPRLTEALLVTLKHDPDPTMRIEALGALSGRADDAQVQMALLSSLRDDQSVQVMDALKDVIGESDLESNSAIFQRARELQESEPGDDWL
jgi:predicted anti-sigma-YlaC factor YlaD